MGQAFLFSSLGTAKLLKLVIVALHFDKKPCDPQNSSHYQRPCGPQTLKPLLESYTTVPAAVLITHRSG